MVNKADTERSTGGSDRMAEASASLRELQEEIAPFVKKRRFDRTTTAGRWQETDAVLTRQHAASKGRAGPS